MADVIIVLLCCGAKGKVHHITCCVGPEGKLRYIYTLSLTLALDRGWVVKRHALAALPPWKEAWYPCTGGWVGPRADLAPTGIRSSAHPVRSELPYRLSYPGPLYRKY